MIPHNELMKLSGKASLYVRCWMIALMDDDDGKAKPLRSTGEEAVRLFKTLSKGDDISDIYTKKIRQQLVAFNVFEQFRRGKHFEVQVTDVGRTFYAWMLEHDTWGMDSKETVDEVADDVIERAYAGVGFMLTKLVPRPTWGRLMQAQKRHNWVTVMVPPDTAVYVKGNDGKAVRLKALGE